MSAWLTTSDRFALFELGNGSAPRFAGILINTLLQQGVTGRGRNYGTVSTVSIKKPLKRLQGFTVYLRTTSLKRGANEIRN
jgi:hypothetical protein